MKNISIDSIRLTNFKGIRNLEITPKSKNIEIFGANGTGKTTIADAINWCLFGKDVLGRANFAIKTIDKETGKELEKLPHEVELRLNVDNSPIKLTRCLNENWNKKNEFKGNTTQYLVNDVELKESEYKEYINELVDETIFLAITNPKYFANLPWQSQRDLLFKMANLQSDEDIMRENPEFAKLADYRMGIDQIKTSVSSKKAKQLKELNEVKIRIDEKERDLSKLEIPEFNLKTIYEVIEDRQAQIREIDESAKDAAALLLQLNKDKKDISDKIFNLEQEKRKMMLEDVNKSREKMHALSGDIDKQKDFIRDISRQIDNLKSRIQSIKFSKDNRNKSLEIKRNEWNSLNSKKAEISAAEFTPDKTFCPTCGKPYTDAEFESMRSAFNSLKSDQLEQVCKDMSAIEAIALDYKKQNNEDDKDINHCNDCIERLDCEMREAKKTLAAIEEKYRNANCKPVEYRSTELIDKEIEELKEKLNSFSSPEATNSLSDRRRELEAELNEWKARANIHKQIDDNNKRIKELQCRQNALIGEIAKLEEIEELIKSFIAFKINAAEDSINSMFEIVRFKLYNYLIDGTPKETCEAMVDNTPYGTLNSAMQINAGIDIINALSRYYNISAPIVIDNKESVTHLHHTEAQIIALTVDEFSTTLNVR